MIDRSSVAFTAIALLATLTVAGGRHRLASAEAAAILAETELKNAQEQADELVLLRARRERVSPRARPQQDVIALMNAVLADAGVPSDHLKNLENESNEALSAGPGGSTSGRYRRQSVAVHLEELTLEQVGKLLAELRTRQSVWTPARIELTHGRTQRDPALLYNLRVLISATYLADDILARPR